MVLDYFGEDSVVPKLIHCSEYQLGITVLSSSVF